MKYFEIILFDDAIADIQNAIDYYVAILIKHQTPCKKRMFEKIFLSLKASK